MALDRSVIEAIGLNWAAADDHNRALERLRSRRRLTLTAENSGKDPIHNLRVLSQVLLYRVVMLGDGCCAAWNGQNPLSAALCARALIETAAVISDYERQLTRLCRDQDRLGITEFAYKRTFATKLPDWLASQPEQEATNTLTLIEKMDPQGTVRSFYNLLSEFCHPNHMGHFILFAEVDVASPTLKLGDNVWKGAGRTKIVEPIFDALSILQPVESWLSGIEQQLPAVFTLCHGADAKH